MTAIERRNPCESLAAVDWSREHVGAVLMQKGKGCAPSHASLSALHLRNERSVCY